MVGKVAHRSVGLLIGVSLAVLGWGTTCEAQALPPLPAWYLEELDARSTGDSVMWVADNSAWKSEQEPFEAYGMRFWPTRDGRGLRGVLFGILNGQPMRVFTEFRVFWHPGQAGEARILSWNMWGGVGEGVMRPGESGSLLLESKDFSYDGSFQMTRHATTRSPGTQVDQQQSLSNGQWVDGRRYIWKRVEDARPPRVD